MNYIERIILERDELSEKLEKLNVFLVQDISVIQKRLLRKQAKAMKKYLDILELRLGDLKEI